jgi:hypothetical protein
LVLLAKLNKDKIQNFIHTKRRSIDKDAPSSLFFANLFVYLVNIQKTYTDLKDESEQMNRLLQQKQLMQIQYTAYYNESKQKAEALAAKARDLKDLLQKLEKQRREAKKKRPPKVSAKPVLAGEFAKTYGRLSWPVSASITPVDYQYLDGKYCFRTALEVIESKLYIISRDAIANAPEKIADSRVSIRVGTSAKS